MVGREVEGPEVVPVRFDFRTGIERVAHLDEDFLELAPDDRDRMQMAEAWSAAGEGDVERFAGLFAGRLFGRDALRFFFERALDAITQLVERVADFFFLLLRDFLEPREERRDQSAL